MLPDCMIWQGAKGKDGYGLIHRRISNLTTRAHRFAYEQAYGSIPDGLLVLHSCDTPLCINPAHLSLGTTSDNQREAVARGRSKVTQNSLGSRFKKGNTMRWGDRTNRGRE